MDSLPLDDDEEYQGVKNHLGGSLASISPRVG